MYPQGRMSHHFRELRVGDFLSVKGPKARNSFFRFEIDDACHDTSYYDAWPICESNIPNSSILCIVYILKNLDVG